MFNSIVYYGIDNVNLSNSQKVLNHGGLEKVQEAKEVKPRMCGLYQATTRSYVQQTHPFCHLPYNVSRC